MGNSTYILGISAFYHDSAACVLEDGDLVAAAQEERFTRREMDLARSVQVVCEEVMLRMARTAHRETGLDDLCLAGGVALNCVGNGRILREGPFDDIWLQPEDGWGRSPRKE